MKIAVPTSHAFPPRIMETNYSGSKSPDQLRGDYSSIKFGCHRPYKFGEIMDRTTKIIICCMLFICCCHCQSDKNTPVTPDDTAVTLSWLHTEGNTIRNEDGNIIILRGVNRSGLEYEKLGNGISKAEIEYICADWKAQIIRLPFNQDWILHDPAYNDYLDEIIGWILANEAYVLLDLQWQDTEVKIPPIPNEGAVGMWQLLAGRYKDNPGVLYDIHNEAHDTSWEAWRQRAIEIIEGIRSVHDKALIFVSGLDWAYDLRGWGTDPLPYENIVYSTHPYPFKAEPWAWDKYFGNFAEEIPIFAGEFGGGEDDLEWGRQLLAYFNAKKMGWTAWSWSNQPYLTQNDRRTPTSFGEIVREALIAHAEQDTTVFTISDIQVLFIASDKATITWQTSVDADSRVYYGLTSAYTDSIYAAAMLTSHSIKLLNLTPASTYHFKVTSSDLYGNTVSSSDSTFQTTPIR